MEKSSLWDDSIKRALENLPADDFNHWDGMEALLNDPANADLSESAEDHILRNKLNDVDPAMPVGHWALMEAQLAGMEGEAGEEELEDMMLDGKAYESLNNLQSPYNAQHWPIMEEKLVDAFSWRKRAVRYKFMELAILLLTFVTVLQYWPEAKEILPKLKKAIPTTTSPAKTTPEQSALADPQPIARADSKNNITNPISTDNIALNNSALTINKSKSTNTTESTLPSSNLASEDLLKLKQQQTDAMKNSVAAQQGMDAEKDIETAAEISNLDFLSSEHQKIEAVPTIPHLKYGPFAAKELPNDAKKIQLGKFLGRSSFRMGMYGLSSLDALEVPQVDGDPISKTEQPTIGYGTGLSLAFKNGRWELESGIGYMSKSVRPNDPKSKELQVSLFLREVANTVWTETKYDMINIPVHVRYNVMDRTKWKMYLQSGLSMNINQNIIYRYDQVITGEGSRNNLLAPGAAEEDRAKAFDTSNVSKNVGTAEERLSSSNSFFNFDVGFGLERALNKRYATFVQSRYSHRLGEAGNIGLEDESTIFRSVQLKAGLKVSLFNNK